MAAGVTPVITDGPEDEFNQPLWKIILYFLHIQFFSKRPILYLYSMNHHQCTGDLVNINIILIVAATATIIMNCFLVNCKSSSNCYFDKLRVQ